MGASLGSATGGAPQNDRAFASLSIATQSAEYTTCAKTSPLKKPLPRFGKIEKTQLIACGLTFPTAMTLAWDGALYISNVGYGVDPTAGLGEVVRIPIDD